MYEDVDSQVAAVRWQDYWAFYLGDVNFPELLLSCKIKAPYFLESEDLLKTNPWYNLS